MVIDPEPRTYHLRDAAAFKRSREQYGKLSNMTGGFPLTVNGVTFQSPEGLYQALKFPANPPLQELIGRQPSGIQAKRAAYATASKPMDQWDNIRVQAMVYTTAVKLAQHPKVFAEALMQTLSRHIVENSSRDRFWGATPASGTYRGANILGKILTMTRDTLTGLEGDIPSTIENMMADIPDETLTINGLWVTDPLPLLDHISLPA